MNMDTGMRTKNMPMIPSAIRCSEVPDRCFSPAAEEVIYEGGSVPPAVLRTDERTGAPAPGDCLLRVWEDARGERYLVLSGAVETSGDILYLTASRCISELYTARDAQLSTYFRVFLAMCLLCGVLSYTVSRVLTAPLEDLSRKLLELLVIRQQGLPLIPASPGALVEQLARQLEPVYREKRIHVFFSREEGACLLEPDLLWSLLLNLADNAQKSMEGGGELRFQQEMTENGCVIRVLDSGRGIPPQALEHLTEAFYRVDKARSRKQGGFGLGLALCQEIAGLHNGSLRFANRPEGGACVTVELRGGRA